MAHFAKLDSENMVVRVHVVDNHNILDAAGNESEEAGAAFLTKLHGAANWKQTSYNSIANTHRLGGTPFRKNYCAAGWFYNEERDAFIAPKPHQSWVLNDHTCIWDAPVPMPDDASPEKPYYWNEEDQQWVAREMPSNDNAPR